MKPEDRTTPTGRVGQVKEVTSLTNPIIKDIRALTQKKARDESGTFMAEGLKLVIDALDLGWTIRTLVYAKAAKGKTMVDEVAAKTVARGGLVLEVSEKVIATVTRRDNPQMVVGIFDQRYRALKDVKPGKGETYVALDRVRDPGNLGTIIARRMRLAPPASFWWARRPTPSRWKPCGHHGLGLRHAGHEGERGRFPGLEPRLRRAACGDPSGRGGDYRTIDYRARPTVLLMGNEQAGLPEELARGADRLARIPQTGRADSLNLAIATGIMLFEARRHLLSLEPAS